MKFLLAASAILALGAGVADAATYHLKSKPETVNRGIISPDIAPALTIKSGDTVTIDTVSHSGLAPDPISYFAKAGIGETQVLKDAVVIVWLLSKKYPGDVVLGGGGF